MNKKTALATLAFITTILLIVFGFHFYKQKVITEKLAAFQAPPVSVTTLIAKESDWTTRIVAVGQVTANDAVDVTPQLGGQVRSIHFNSGDAVTAGDLLIQLDDQLEQDELEREAAKVKLAQLDVDRYSKLVKERSASQATLDRAQVTLQTNRASAHATQTKIDYMAIKAPFDGRLGIRKVNVGEFIEPGTAIVNLQDTSVLYVDFSLPESHLPKLSNGLTVEVRSDAYPDASYTAEIIAISPEVDPNSRNVDIRGRLSEGSPLTPGMYVELHVVTLDTVKVVRLPSVAVAYSLYGDQVYVVGAPAGEASSGDSQRYKVEQRSVNVIAERDAEVAIDQGLKAGDQIITSNQQQLNAKSIIVINNKVKLDSSQVTGQ